MSNLFLRFVTEGNTIKWCFLPVFVVEVKTRESYLLSVSGPSWLCSYGSWIYNYLCNKCLSPLRLQVWIPLRQGVLDATLCDKVCQWLVAGLWFSLCPPVSSTNKTDRHDITEILLKVALNTITPNPYTFYLCLLLKARFKNHTFYLYRLH